MNLESYRHFFQKKSHIPNFIKIRPVRAELFHAGGRTDGQTDMMKPIVAFLQFCELTNKNQSLRQGLNTVP
jgi:hypothetical protein